jgi:hypothetical protein
MESSLLTDIVRSPATPSGRAVKMGEPYRGLQGNVKPEFAAGAFHDQQSAYIASPEHSAAAARARPVALSPSRRDRNYEASAGVGVGFPLSCSIRAGTAARAGSRLSG